MSINKASLAVISTSPDKIEVFAITSDKTGLGHISFNGSAWSSWSVVGLIDDGFYKSAPTAISTQPGIIDVFIVNTDDQLKTRHFNGKSWRPDIGWEYMMSDIAETGTASAVALFWDFPTQRYDVLTRALNGGVLAVYNYPGYPEEYDHWWAQVNSKAPPIKIITGYNAMEMFYIGYDDTVRHMHWMGEDDNWAPARTLGDQKFISPPTPVTIGPGRVDLFGIATNQTVLYNTYQNKEWTGWKQLGTRRFASALSAVVPQGTNHIELWGLGEDGALWHRGYDGTRWPIDWDSHKGNFSSAPAVVSAAPGVYDVFAIGTDGTLKHARRNETSTTWLPGYAVWNSLGGSLFSF